MENTVSDDFQKKKLIRREKKKGEKSNYHNFFFCRGTVEVIIFCYCTKNERTKFLSYFDVSGIKCLICKYKVPTLGNQFWYILVEVEEVVPKFHQDL